MKDEQLLRYSRHILLDELGIEGQQRLLDARALIGVDLDQDRSRGYTVSDGGITVVGKGITVRR